MKIMVSFDGSENSNRAIDRVVEFFKASKPTIILTMISEIPSGFGSYSGEAIERGIDHDRKVFNEATDRLKNIGLDVDPVFEAEGDARHMIMKVIKSKSPDLVVFGKRGRGRLAEMLLGSVSEYYVRHAPCPVLVIH